MPGAPPERAARHARKAWEQRLAASAHKAEFNRVISGALPANFDEVIANYKKELAKSPPWIATRNASQNALDVINAAVPETIGGSADLTGSNNTKSKDLKPSTPPTMAAAISITASASMAWPPP